MIKLGVFVVAREVFLFTFYFVRIIHVATLWLNLQGQDNNSKSTATAAVYSLTYQCKQKPVSAPSNLTSCESQGLQCWYTLHSAVSQKRVELSETTMTAAISAPLI